MRGRVHEWVRRGGAWFFFFAFCIWWTCKKKGHLITPQPQLSPPVYTACNLVLDASQPPFFYPPIARTTHTSSAAALYSSVLETSIYPYSIAAKSPPVRRCNPCLAAGRPASSHRSPSRPLFPLSHSVQSVSYRTHSREHPPPLSSASHVYQSLLFLLQVSYIIITVTYALALPRVLLSITMHLFFKKTWL